MTELVEHCEGLFTWADTAQHVSTAFAGIVVFVATILLIWQACVEICRLKKTPRPNTAKVRSLAGAAAEVVEALPNLFNSLAKAPATVILVAVAALLVWLPDPKPGETCLKAYEAQLKAKTEIELTKIARSRFPVVKPESFSKVNDAKGLKTTVVWVQPSQPSK